MATIRLLHGDSFLVHEKCRLILQQLDVEVARTLGPNDSAARAVEEGHNLPFMEEYNLIRLDGVLKSGREGGRDNRTEEWAKAIPAMAALPPSTMYVWTEQKLPRNSRVARLARQHGEVEELNAPTGRNLREWARARATEKGGELSAEGADALVTRAKEHLWRISHEVDKLTLWSDGELIQRRQVEMLAEERSEETVFKAIDDLFQGRADRAARAFEGIVDGGQSPFYILTMLQREGRMLAMAESLTKEGARQADMMAALGTTSEYALRKTLEHLDRLDDRGVEGWYDALQRADTLIKNGSLNGRQAVTALAAELAQRREDWER